MLDQDGASPGLSSKPKSSRRRTTRNAVSGLILLAIIVWAANFVLIGNPIREELNSDSRNEAYSLTGHYRYYVDISTLVLDLRRVDAAAPVDLFRGLFQAAKAMHESGHTFSRIVLARSRTPVFMMKGDDFEELGKEQALGQNPVYLIRTLPQKLYRLDGESAFGSWTGGLLSVVGRQMEDANRAASEWAGGR